MKVGDERGDPAPENARAPCLTAPDSKGEVQLQAGIVKLKAHLSQLRLVKAENAPKQKSSFHAQSRRHDPDGIHVLRRAGHGPGRGHPRAWTSTWTTAVMASLNEVSIIHGKGTGVLRSGIQQHLRHHHAREELPPGRIRRGGERRNRACTLEVDDAPLVKRITQGVCSNRLWKDKPYILLVDDDPNIRHLVQLYLEKEGFEVRPGRPRRRRPWTMFASFAAEPDAAGRDAARHGRLAGLPRGAQDHRPSPSSCSPPRTRPSTRCWGWSWARTTTSPSPSTRKELVARIKAVHPPHPGRGGTGKDRGALLPGPDHQHRASTPSPTMGKPVGNAAQGARSCSTSSPAIRTWSSPGNSCWSRCGASITSAIRRTVDVHIKRLREKLPGCEKVPAG